MSPPSQPSAALRTHAAPPAPAPARPAEPVFNERFTFVAVSSSYSTELVVTVLDKNVMASDKVIGSARIPLARAYASRAPEDLRVQLSSPKGKTAGELQLLVTFRPAPGQAAAAAPAAPVAAVQAPAPAPAPAPVVLAAPAPAPQPQVVYVQQQPVQQPVYAYAAPPAAVAYAQPYSPAYPAAYPPAAAPFYPAGF